MRALLTAAGALAAVTLAGPVAPARAAPTVTIKARTMIEIDPVRRSYDGIVVRGRVVDKFSRVGIGWADVVINLDSLSRRVVTDGDGLFEAYFNTSGGRHDLIVEFPGDLHNDPSRYQIANFDVTKNPVTLTLTLSRGVANYGVDDLTALLSAASDFGGVALPISLHLGDEGDDPADFAEIGRATTDRDGNAEIALPADRLGSPGGKLVVARFAGNDAYDAAEARANLMLKTDTAITFDGPSPNLEFEGTLRGRGRVVDGRGDGIEGGAVSLVVGTRHLAETATKSDGSYAFKVAASEIGSGKYNVQAVFEPAKEWQRSSRSQPVTVVIAEPEPVPVSYTIAAFSATAFALLAFVGLRTRPWERWLARVRAHRADDDTADGTDDRQSGEELHTGLSLARPSLVSTLRRTKDHGFAGVVRNAVTHRPVGGARMTLASADREVDVEVDGAGRFATDMLSTGDWQVTVTAWGYVTEGFAIHVPHRGELRGARVDLLPVRERIFAMYGETARPLLPEAGLWGIWTPRQIFDHVRADRPPASALASLTDFVEETYFSQRTPGEELIDEARDRIAAARLETRQS